MKTATLGVLLVAGFVVVAVGLPTEPSAALAQQRLGSATPAVSPPVERDAGRDLIALSTVVADKYQQVVVIDPHQQVMSVYQVALTNGDVKLCCVRNIHWDLQMTHYNGESPLPREIQSLLNTR